MALKKKKILVKQQQRVATVQPKSFNEDKNTVDVVFSTGARVMRRSFWGDVFAEELDMKRSSIRLDRLKKGAPVLDSHNRFSLSSQIGVVESARVEKGEGLATLRLSDLEEHKPIVDNIRSGIIKNISVGYITHKSREDEEDGLRVFRAVDWEPTEISFVTVPADAGAQARSAEMEQEYECEVEYEERSGEDVDPDPDIDPDPDPAPVSERTSSSGDDPVSNTTTTRVEDKPMDPKKLEEQKREAAKKAVEAERARVSSIKDVCTKARVSDEHLNRFIDEGVSIEDVRTQVIDLMAADDDKNPTNSANTRIESGENLTRANALTGIEGAILNRHNNEKFELDDNSKRFVHMNMIGMARASLSAAGVDVSMASDREIAKMAIRSAGYHSSSDFPLALENVLNKTMQIGYQEAPRT